MVTGVRGKTRCHLEFNNNWEEDVADEVGKRGRCAEFKVHLDTQVASGPGWCLILGSHGLVAGIRNRVCCNRERGKRDAGPRAQRRGPRREPWDQPT